MDIVRFILEVAEISGADHRIVNHKNANGQSPLMVAARSGSIALCELIVAHGGIFGAVDNFGSNCLHFAASSSESECLGYLLEVGGEDYIDFVNDYEESPLFVAVKAKALECTEVLLMRGAHVTSDVLELASGYRDLGYMDLLLDFLEASSYGSSVDEGHTTGKSNPTDEGRGSMPTSPYGLNGNLYSPIAIEKPGAIQSAERTGREYYHNTVRKESTWQDPRWQRPPAIEPLHLCGDNAAVDHRPSKQVLAQRPGTTSISMSTPGQTRAITTTTAESDSDRAKVEARNILLDTMRKKTETSQQRAEASSQPRMESLEPNQSNVRAREVTAVSQVEKTSHGKHVASSISAPMEPRLPLGDKGNLVSNSMLDRNSVQPSQIKSKTQNADASTLHTREGKFRATFGEFLGKEGG